MKKFWVDLKALSKSKDVKATIDHITNSIKEGFEGGVTENNVQWCTLDNTFTSYLYWFIIRLCLLLRYGRVIY
jgi:hypothetical protein